MVGRQMLGKIEFKLRNTLKGEFNKLREGTYLVNRDAVLAGDPKQAPPIGDDPMYREGAYRGKGKNKPRGADGTPNDAWDMEALAVNGMGVRDSFDDVVLLREVHRYEEACDDIPEDKRELYREDARRFLEVTRGMADCNMTGKWSETDHAWLSRRNRSVLQQTKEGRNEIWLFDNAPLLMDGRVDTMDGGVGANRMNMDRLERLSAETNRPIVAFCEYLRGQTL